MAQGRNRPARWRSTRMLVQTRSDTSIVAMRPKCAGTSPPLMVVEPPHARPAPEEAQQRLAIAVDRDVEDGHLVAVARVHAPEEVRVALDPGDELGGLRLREAKLVQRADASASPLKTFEAAHGPSGRLDPQPPRDRVHGVEATARRTSRRARRRPARARPAARAMPFCARAPRGRLPRHRRLRLRFVDALAERGSGRRTRPAGRARAARGRIRGTSRATRSGRTSRPRSPGAPRRGPCPRAPPGARSEAVGLRV